ncbi:MAG: DUF5640 domain-containing protein [Phycisphaerales bacterium]
MLQMRRTAVVCTVLLLSVLGGCNRDSSKIKGRWSNAAGDLVWEFAGDGKVTEERLLGKSSGTYALDNGRLIIRMEYWLTDTTYDFKYEFPDGKSLRLSDGQGANSKAFTGSKGVVLTKK